MPKTRKTPVCKPVYELRGALRGRGAFVVAPGPSLADFPIQRLSGLLTVCLNSAVELIPEPALWMYADKKFTHLYRVPLRKGKPPRVLVAKHQCGMKRWYPGEIIWFYEWQHPVKRYSPKQTPWWLFPKRNYLPGHCSVVSNAMSFCELVGLSPVILVGVDFQVRRDQYYAPGIKYNKGPTMRERALGSGLRWFRSALEKPLWPSVDIYTMRGGGLSLQKSKRIKEISPEEALGMGKSWDEWGCLRMNEDGDGKDS